MKKRRIFCFCFALIIAFLIPLNAFALGPANLSDDYLFTPFHMSLLGTVRSSNPDLDGLEYEIGLFDQLFADSSDSAYFNTSKAVSSYSVGNSFITFTVVPRETYNFGNSDSIYSYFPITTEATYGSNIDIMSSGYSVYFQGGFLSPRYSLTNAGDGGVFSFVDDSGSPLMSLYRGEFVVAGHFMNDCDFSYYGQSLNYYQVLYNSDVDWLSILPSNIDVDQWILYYSSFSSLDFENLSSDDLDKLSFCFDFVGPVYSRCDASISSGSSSSSLNVRCIYSFINSRQFERNVQDILEISNASQKTPFQRVTQFLGSAVSGFLSVEIMPNFTIGGVLLILITFSIVLWWLKVFSGG